MLGFIDLRGYALYLFAHSQRHENCSVPAEPSWPQIQYRASPAFSNSMRLAGRRQGAPPLRLQVLGSHGWTDGCMIDPGNVSGPHVHCPSDVWGGFNNYYPSIWSTAACQTRQKNNYEGFPLIAVQISR